MVLGSARGDEQAGQDLVDRGQDDVGKHLNQFGREPSLGGDRREGSFDQSEAVALPQGPPALPPEYRGRVASRKTSSTLAAPRKRLPGVAGARPARARMTALSKASSRLTRAWRADASASRPVLFRLTIYRGTK